MPKALDYIKPIAGGGVFSPQLRNQISNFFGGSPEKHERVPTLLPEQMQNFQGLQNAAQGSFGTAADYYRNLLSNESPDFEAFAAPELRRFREDILPSLGEQFAGFGSGALNSSGFRNASTNAATDLSERLGALRAQLRQQGAQGLQNLGAQSLGNFSQDVMTQPGSQGLLSQIGPAAVSAGIGYVTGGPGGAVAGAVQPFLTNQSSFGKTSPYGGMTQSASNTSGRFNLPTFMGR